jgi:regulator of protease activity HflC (stomatin/prohibitin superfamily)
LVRIDRDGRILQQITVWLPVELADLLRADGINLSRFIRDQIAFMYDDPGANPASSRDRLMQAARESIARHRAAEKEFEAGRERARAAVRVMRAEREASRARQAGILDALHQIIGDDPTDRYRRMLPENDPNGDRADDWDALVRRVSRLCGAEIDSAEVADRLRALVAKS